MAKWRQNQSLLLDGALQSLNNLAKLVKEESMLLRAARELRNYLCNMLPSQTCLLPEPAQLKALYPVRSWLPWFPSIMEYNRERDRFIAPFLANYEMVRMAQAVVLPGIRHSIGLHERAMAIRSASTQLGSGFEASGVHTSSVMHAPLSIAQSYLHSSSGNQT
jgi:hypothetical protein